MILAIDGSNLLHRVLRTSQIDLINSKGLRTGGLHGIIKSIHKLCRDKRFVCLPIVCWDEGIIKFRRSIYSGYKDHKKVENRDQVPVDPSKAEEEEVFLSTLLWSKNLLHSSILPLLSIPSVMVPGVEADDIIAFICENIKNEQITIVSNDADLLQLINDRVQVYKPVTETVYDKKKFIEEYDLIPEKYQAHFVLMKAMCGGEDGIPHVIKGLGPKGAIKIAKRLILDEPLDLNDKKQQAVSEKIKEIYRNVNLMSLPFFQIWNIEGVEEIRKGLSNSILNQDFDEFVSYKKFDSLELNEAKSYVPDLGQTGWMIRQRLKELVINNYVSK